MHKPMVANVMGTASQAGSASPPRSSSATWVPLAAQPWKRGRTGAGLPAGPPPADTSTVLAEIPSSLFTCRDQSVRITSLLARGGPGFLKVEGPHSKRACYEVRDEQELLDLREQLEEALVAQGFARRLVVADRREQERRQGQRPGERRQPWQSPATARPCPPDWAGDAAS